MSDTVNPTYRPSIDWASAVSLTCPDDSGTRLTQTRTSTITLILSFVGSSSGVVSTDPTVTGYSSSMYDTASSLPIVAS